MKRSLILFVFTTLISINAHSTIPCAGCGPLIRIQMMDLATQDVAAIYQRCVAANGKQNEKCKAFDEILTDARLEVSKMKYTMDKSELLNVYNKLQYNCNNEHDNEYLKCSTLNELVKQFDKEQHF